MHMKKVHKNSKSKKPKVTEQIEETFEFEHESRQKKKLKKEEVKDEPLELVIENDFTINEKVENPKSNVKVKPEPEEFWT